MVDDFRKCWNICRRRQSPTGVGLNYSGTTFFTTGIIIKIDERVIGYNGCINERNYYCALIKSITSLKSSSFLLPIRKPISSKYSLGKFGIFRVRPLKAGYILLNGISMVCQLPVVVKEKM